MVSTHQVGHKLDLIFAAEVMLDLITVKIVPWSEHHTLKVHMNILPQPCLGDEHILACPQSQIDPMQYQVSLWNPMPQGGSLDKLVEYWHGQLSFF